MPKKSKGVGTAMRSSTYQHFTREMHYSDLCDCRNCRRQRRRVSMGSLCPAGGTHDWHTITKDGKKISVCQKCGATK